ncbi:MAG: PilT/PilU family type 4a pilus ATPase [Archangium sp.]|nr:PilT/PilU family type 4a pilus ATPase [Archangium sp.]
MTPLELVAKFKVSTFDNPSEAEALAAAIDGAIDAPTVMKCVEFLLSKASSGQPMPHKRRCQALDRLSENCFDQALFVPLARALKPADPVLRTTLCRMLVRTRVQNQFGEVAAHLNTPDAGLRQIAAALLTQLGGKPAFDQLAEVLKDKRNAGRNEAIEALVRVGGQHALPVIQMVLANASTSERTLALKCLGDSPSFAKSPADAILLLSGLLNDANDAIAVQAIQTFNRICTEDNWFDLLAPIAETERVVTVKAAVEGLQRFPSPRSMGVLERKLRAGPNAVRFAVLNVLEAIGTDDILTVMVEALGSRHLVVRTKAGEALQRLSKAQKLDLIRTVVWLLKSRDLNVRRMALEIAKSIQDPNNQLWPKLMHLLRDEDWWVRERVIDVLVELAGTSLTRHIAQYLGDPSDVVRRYAVNVLARLKDPQSLGLLVRTAQQDTDWWVREKAIETIALLGDAKAIPHLEHLLRSVDELKVSLITALKDMKSRASGPLVAEFLRDEDPEVRLLVLDTLELLGDPAMASAVSVGLEDVLPKVRDRARRLLSLWKMSGTTEAPKVLDGLSPLDRMLAQVAQAQGDDFILTPGRIPAMKRMGKIVPVAKKELTPTQTRDLLMSRLTSLQHEELKALRDIDFSYEIPAAGLRFRVNVFAEHQGLAAVFRIVKGRIPDIASLNLPKSMLGLSEFRNGLVLVGGPTGSGKSTTLAAVINSINEKEGRHIISLEDPIEAIHLSKKSLVNQREIGTHTMSYSDAMRSTLRQDPDVILVGELRDLPTIQFAVTAAETGHLVFGTVHTVSADTTVDRLINAFPPQQQEQVRSMLAQSLRAVCCQFLLKGADGKSRHLATEVMFNNDAIGALIRKGKAFQLPSTIASSREEGMQLMDQDLMRLMKEQKISPDEAYLKARSKKEFEPFIAGGEKAGAAGSVTAPAKPGSPERDAESTMRMPAKAPARVVN